MKKEYLARDTFDHLVELAALELNEEQAEYLRRELNHQLSAIEELAAVPLDADIRVTPHGVPYTAENSAPLRPDEWHPYPHPEEILSQAPETADRYIIVPDIPHTTLE
jgi:aspartyl/glutamyl-tRNA(Asn/Gln) amidotransferase C subunit